MELAQVGEVGEPPQTASAQNGISADRANARDTQQLASACGHYLNGGFAQAQLCPGTLGIEIEAQIAIIYEGQLLDLPTIVTQQKARLVQAVFSERVGCG